MVPPKEPKELVGQRYKHRSTGQIGEVCKNIKKAHPDKMKQCGIYEWQARGTFVGQPDKVVVYVGSTCAAKYTFYSKFYSIALMARTKKIW